MPTPVFYTRVAVGSAAWHRATVLRLEIHVSGVPGTMSEYLTHSARQ